MRVGGQCHAPATLSLRAPVSIVKEAGWAPGLVGMDIEERKALVHTGVCRQSLHWLCHRGHPYNMWPCCSLCSGKPTQYRHRIPKYDRSLLFKKKKKKHFLKMVTYQLIHVMFLWKSKVIPLLHYTSCCEGVWGNGCAAPSVLGTNWKWAVSFMPHLCYPWGKKALVSVDWGAGWAPGLV